MLATSGDPKDTKLESAQVDGETLYLRITDAQTGTYWRSISGLRGHLLTLTAAGVGSIALDPDEGRDLLAKALTALQKANPKPRVPKAG